MRMSSTFLTSLYLVLILSASSAAAKEGVKATVHTPISASAIEGSEIHVMWSLAEEKSGKPFSACAVFIRLIGPTGETTEASAKCGQEAAKGNYDASPVVPNGGISRIEIGVAGTITDREGASQRSDWLMPLMDDPMAD